MRLPQVHPDDRGSLPMVMLLITVGLGLSAMLGPLVVRQVVATRDAAARNAALNAAQAGMDMMMARVRAAAKPAGDKFDGQLEDLPACSLSGDAGVDADGVSMDYTVAITYLDESDGPMACPPLDVPTKATVVVRGTSGKSTRELTATYVFTTSNTNIPGGQIKITASSLGSDQCFDAGAAKSPPAGALGIFTMRSCNGSSRQQFAYTRDLYLKLVNSESATAKDGMCLHAGATHTTSSMVVFQACPAPSVSPGKPNGLYQWSLDGFSQFHAVTAGNVMENDLCITVKMPAQAGSHLGLGPCERKWETTMYRTAASVGAGMAGDSTAQLVNYAQFGRCLDFTDRNPSAGYMIVWFCKQDPDGVVEANQRWVHPIPVLPAVSATGNIVVTKDEIDTTPYCLWSPLSTAATAYATVKPCAGNTLAVQTQWTVFHETDSYATSYRIKDSSGYCLTPTDLDVTPPDTHWDGTAKVKVAVCSSSELQKWNAPANIKKPTPLTNLTEK